MIAMMATRGKGRCGWRRQAGDVILLTTEPSDLFTTVRSHGSLGSHALLNDSYLCTWRGVFLGFPTICRPYSVNLFLPLISYISFHQDVIRHLPQPGVNSTFKHRAPSILLKSNMYARGKYFALMQTSSLVCFQTYISHFQKYQWTNNYTSHA